jgi:hypothetical protein
MRPLTRIAIVTLVCLLAGACYKLQAANDMKMIEGTVVSAESGSLVVKDDKSHEHTYSVDSSVQIMMDGKMAKLEDLKKNMSVSVALDGDKVMSVNASNPMKL